MKKLLIGLTVIVALLVLFLMMGPFYIIDEGSQAVVTRFGKIVDFSKTKKACGLLQRTKKSHRKMALFARLQTDKYFLRRTCRRRK